VAAAPALRRPSVTAMPQLTAERFRCFLGHPRLEELRADTGTTKVNEAVKGLFAGIARSRHATVPGSSRPVESEWWTRPRSHKLPPDQL
jgi:hypothetical protein